MLMKKLALFDLDGTIFDTSDVNYYAYLEGLKHYGYALDYDFYCKECNGRHYTYFLPLLGIENTEMMEKIHKIKKTAYSSYLEHARVNEHLVRILKTMAGDYNRVIVTTASRRNTEEILLHYDLLKEFDLLLSQEDIQNPKPNPEGFLLAMGKFHAQPEDTIIFEDSDVGIEAALLTGAAVMRIKQF